MRSGAMRQRIQLVSQATAQDPYGQPTQGSSTPVLSTWACITVATGREIYALGAGFTSQVTHKVVIRFPAVQIQAGMQILYQGRTFRIQAVSDPTERRRELDLMVLEESK